jgi:hypothetical protein
MTKQRIEAVEPWENQSVRAEPEPAWDASMRLAKPQSPQELKPVNDWVKPFERFWTRQADRIKRRAEEKAAKVRLAKSHEPPEIKTLDSSNEERRLGP